MPFCLLLGGLMPFVSFWPLSCFCSIYSVILSCSFCGGLFEPIGGLVRARFWRSSSCVQLADRSICVFSTSQALHGAVIRQLSQKPRDALPDRCCAPSGRISKNGCACGALRCIGLFCCALVHIGVVFGALGHIVGVCRAGDAGA